MARVKVWIEAREEYLVRRNLGDRKELEKLSDDALCKYYYNVIQQKGLEEDAHNFTRAWCMQYK